MNAVKKLVMSFVFAFRGIGYCIRTCRNFRIHTVAAFVVFYFSSFYGFSKTEYAVLFLTVASVIIFEAINSAIELLCDKITKEHSNTVKHIKDIAAGVVLLSAMCSVLVAVALFWDMDKFKIIYSYFTSTPEALLVLTIIAVISVIYIFYEDIFKYGKK